MPLPFLQRELHIRFTVSQFLLFGAWAIALFYMGWEYYWFTKVDWLFVKWHTHLAPYMLLLLVLFTYTRFVRVKENTLLLLSSVCVGLMLAELIVYALYAPSDVTFYHQFRTNPTNYYHTWFPNEKHDLKNIEFSYSRHTNSLGFSDREWAVQKDTTKLRIITLGDSFTEGDAAPADSAYPFLLQQILGERVEVLNAGICGCDPVFNYKNLEDRLLKYQPDVVIQTISTNDLFKDISLRGGFERFMPEGVIYTPSPPIWFYPALISTLW